MEFDATIVKLCTQPVSSWSTSQLERLAAAPRTAMIHLIDTMGAASAKAQGLGHVITTFRSVIGANHRCYIATEGRNQVNGLLKVGEKRLFIRDDTGRVHEITPLCVLDFYVHESCQRKGVGRLLFDFMLQAEGGDTPYNPARIAYDRPSPKLIAFMAKHFGLSSYTPQNNNFVVFRKYFELPLLSASARRKRDDVKETLMSRAAAPKRSDVTSHHNISSTSSAAPSSSPFSSAATVGRAAVAGRRASFNGAGAGQPVAALHMPVSSAMVSSNDVAIATAAMAAYNRVTDEPSLRSHVNGTTGSTSLMSNARSSRPNSATLHNGSTGTPINTHNSREPSSHVTSSSSSSSQYNNGRHGHGNARMSLSSSSSASSPRTSSVSQYTSVAPVAQSSNISSAPFGYYVAPSSSYTSVANGRRASLSGTDHGNNGVSVPGSALPASSSSSVANNSARQISGTRLRGSSSAASVINTSSMEPSHIYTSNYSNATNNVSGRYGGPSAVAASVTPSLPSPASSSLISRRTSLNSRPYGAPLVASAAIDSRRASGRNDGAGSSWTEMDALRHNMSRLQAGISNGASSVSSRPTPTPIATAAAAVSSMPMTSIARGRGIARPY